MIGWVHSWSEYASFKRLMSMMFNDNATATVNTFQLNYVS